MWVDLLLTTLLNAPLPRGLLQCALERNPMLQWLGVWLGVLSSQNVFFWVRNGTVETTERGQD